MQGRTVDDATFVVTSIVLGARGRRNGGFGKADDSAARLRRCGGDLSALPVLKQRRTAWERRWGKPVAALELDASNDPARWVPCFAPHRGPQGPKGRFLVRLLGFGQMRWRHLVTADSESHFTPVYVLMNDPEKWIT